MFRIRLDAADIGRIRFAEAPAPVLEAALMLFELRREHYDGPYPEWCREVLATFPAEGGPLGDLVRPTRAVYFLDVLAPDAEHGFDLVRATPTADLRRDLGFVWPDRMPAWLDELARGTKDARATVVSALRACHRSCVAPRWPAVARLFEADIADRTELLRRHGVAAVLDTLSPAIRLRGNVLEVLSRMDEDIRTGGHGLILMPSAFWTGPPLVTWDRQEPDQCVIIYPARAREARPAGHGDALAALLGTTRADVLRALVLPLTTTGLARQLWISRPSASQHATALRDAGLITSRRAGKIVEHHITGLGLSLVRSTPFGIG